LEGLFYVHDDGTTAGDSRFPQPLAPKLDGRITVLNYAAAKAEP
jgi:hypothetical protein